MKIKPENLYNILSELAMVAGFLLLIYGIYLIYIPAAYMFGGLGLFMLGFPGKLLKRGKK